MLVGTGITFKQAISSGVHDIWNDERTRYVLSHSFARASGAPSNPIYMERNYIWRGAIRMGMWERGTCRANCGVTRLRPLSVDVDDPDVFVPSAVEMRTRSATRMTQRAMRVVGLVQQMPWMADSG